MSKFLDLDVNTHSLLLTLTILTVASVRGLCLFISSAMWNNLSSEFKYVNIVRMYSMHTSVRCI